MTQENQEYNFISAKIIADSFNNHWGKRITTFELEYPRFIHSEIMTHRVFSRNAQSSRAVPVQNTLGVNANPVRPIVWGKNKAGMSSQEVLNVTEQAFAENLWNTAAGKAFEISAALADQGLHKQWANRITEPFSKIKVVITATEWDNFFWLRIDPDAAQPEIVELARVMQKAYDESEPKFLTAGQWHMPYVDWRDDARNLIGQSFFDTQGNYLNLDEALKISASCCAQVSYRKLNDTKEKAIEIFNRLFSGAKPHLSPTEHQAMCFSGAVDIYGDWRKGITHKDRDDFYWSGNLNSFIQYRQLL